MNATNKKQEKPRQVLRVTAKCSDMFHASLLPGLDGEAVSEHDGYVPSWFPNTATEHYGDYVELEIDLATGQILNWKRPTKEQLEETFGKKDSKTI